MADFQQYYNLDSLDIGKGISYYRAATLCSQLPRGSRVLRELDSTLYWDDLTELVAQIEHNQRSYVYGKTPKNKRPPDGPKAIRPAKNKRERLAEQKRRLTTETGEMIQVVTPDVIAKKFNYKKED